MERLNRSSNLRICTRQRPPILKMDLARERLQTTPGELYHPHLHNHLPPLSDQHRFLHRIQRHHLRAGGIHHAYLLHLHVLRSLPPCGSPGTDPKSTLESRPLGCTSQQRRYRLRHVHLLLVVLAQCDPGHATELQLGCRAVPGYAFHFSDHVRF